MVERMTAAQLREMQEKPKKQKYGAQRIVVDGITFDSKKEAGRWAELKLLERAGEIINLRRQVVVPLEGRDGPLLARKGRQMRITVDFGYVEVATGLMVYEDAKGLPTRDYEVRRSVAAAQGVEIVEV
jgi:hypothetical protein